MFEIKRTPTADDTHPDFESIITASDKPINPTIQWGPTFPFRLESRLGI